MTDRPIRIGFNHPDPPELPRLPNVYTEREAHKQSKVDSQELESRIRELFHEPRNEELHAQCAIADCLRVVDQFFREKRGEA